MARIKVNILCNVCTDEDSKAYRSHGRPIAPEITVPHLRLRMRAQEARALAHALTEAASYAEGLEQRVDLDRTGSL